VVEDLVDGMRFKLLNTVWEASSVAVKRLVHPAVMWDALRCGSAQQLMANQGLPQHAQLELNCMADKMLSLSELPMFDYALSPDWPLWLTSLKPDCDGSLGTCSKESAVPWIDVLDFLVSAWAQEKKAPIHQHSSHQRSSKALPSIESLCVKTLLSSATSTAALDTFLERCLKNMAEINLDDTPFYISIFHSLFFKLNPPADKFVHTVVEDIETAEYFILNYVAFQSCPLLAGPFSSRDACLAAMTAHTSAPVMEVAWERLATLVDEMDVLLWKDWLIKVRYLGEPYELCQSTLILVMNVFSDRYF
jgi:hypothetical protein